MLRAKTQKAEIEAAIQRGELVQKRLVEKQRAFLLISLRQRILAFQIVSLASW
jgi:hypothetical protein